MADRVQDFWPLPPACARALSDKLYEKRKGAALDIDRLVRDLVQSNSTDQIEKLLHVLTTEFALSPNGNARKGGLIGLAALAIAMGKECTAYLPQLIEPVIACFKDPDNRTRYFACEALYNIVKIARSAVLLHFNTVVKVLSQLAADPDINVKNGSELLDRLMKDIVTESPNFDLVAFVPLLRERIYVTNSFVRQFILSWITTLNSVPDINLLIYLPEILDGMFHILGDTNKEIRKMCEFCLDHFMKEIKQSPTSVDYPSMVNVLIAHSQSNDELIQLTAINWLVEFLNQAGRNMIPFSSGLLNATLPCMAYDRVERKNIKEAAKLVNKNLMRLITAEDDKDDDESEDRPHNASPLSQRSVRLDVRPMVDVLTRFIQHDSMQCKITALRWTYHLHMKTPRKIFKHVENIFPVLVGTLSDISDEVVLLDLEVLAEVVSSSAGPTVTSQSAEGGSSSQHAKAASCMNAYFHKFMTKLLQLFASDRQLLDDRGSFIIRQLCLLLNTEDIYRTLSEILVDYKDLQFATDMVQTLNSILLTATELFELRNQLKDLVSERSCMLFYCLYKSWCHSPIATVSLCFLTQNYAHASSLIYMFGDLEVTVHFLTEIDKLVQLLESPIFTYLRLQLLDTEHNQYLVKSLYGLLMLLPQSTAFTTLQRRLACVPSLLHLPKDQRKNSPGLIPDKRPNMKALNWDEMLIHFKILQAQHNKTKRQRMRSTDEQLQSLKI